MLSLFFLFSISVKPYTGFKQACMIQGVSTGADRDGRLHIRMFPLEGFPQTLLEAQREGQQSQRIFSISGPAHSY